MSRILEEASEFKVVDSVLLFDKRGAEVEEGGNEDDVIFDDIRPGGEAIEHPADRQNKGNV